MKLPARIVVLLLASCALASTVAAAEEVTFGRDVMAVFSKAGCNAGTCHGNQNGKGGFRLSLRGQDPAADYESVVRDQFARRTNPLEPEKSLVLLKPTMSMAHEGGKRFAADSAEYRILHDWIAAGMPVDPPTAPRLVSVEVSPTEQYLTEPTAQAQLSVRAKFSDESQRDVSSMAVYEPSSTIVNVGHGGLVEFKGFGEVTVVVRYLHLQVPVRLAYIPSQPDFVWKAPSPANYIDEHVFAKLQQLRVNPSDLTTDTEFIRRAYLDALGILPTAEEARTFLADASSDKRAKLIDALLARSEFADFWAQKWSDLLRNEEKVLDSKGVRIFHEWIRSSIADSKPLDQFVRELVASRGSTYAVPPANFYRANRDAVSRAEAAAQVFLGVRLGCAKCHNHPFDRWTQDDYYSWTALFSRVDYKIVENHRRDDNDKHEFKGEQIVLTAAKGDVKDPRTGRVMQPRFLGADEQIDADEERLEPLAAWLTSPDNDLFVRSQVNRIWFHLLGRGIVDPIDDFRQTNPPINPALLDALAKDFVEHKFDLKHLVRTIMNSATYQLSAAPNETNASDELNFSHATVRRLSAEQLLDAVSHTTGSTLELSGYPTGTRAGQMAGVPVLRRRGQDPGEGDQFLRLFGKPPRLLTCECERSTDSTLSHAFQMLSGPTIHEMLAADDNGLSRMLASGKSNAEIIDELYWSALSRAPTSKELGAATAHFDGSGDRRVALEDITWAILNSKEFLLRR